jgi:hypothetical protein
MSNKTIFECKNQSSVRSYEKMHEQNSNKYIIGTYWSTSLFSRTSVQKMVPLHFELRLSQFCDQCNFVNLEQKHLIVNDRK